MNALDTALDTASAAEVPGHWRRACRAGELGAARTCPTRVPRMGGHARPRLHPACEWQRKTGARREVAHGGGGGGLADSTTGVVPFIYSSSDFHVFLSRLSRPRSALSPNHRAIVAVRSCIFKLACRRHRSMLCRSTDSAVTCGLARRRDANEKPQRRQLRPSWRMLAAPRQGWRAQRHWPA